LSAVSEHRSALGLAAVAAAAAGWAGAAVVARDLFGSGVSPLQLAAARSVIAATGLAVVGRRRLPRASAFLSPTVIALGLAVAWVNAAYYLAIARLPVAVAIVLQYTGPALVVIWAATVERRKPPPEVLIALVAATIGVALVVELVGGNVGGLDGGGVLFGLASAVLFACYSLLSEQAGRAYGAVGALFRAFVVASVFWMLVQIPLGWPHQLFEPRNVPGVLFVGIAGTLVPFLLYVWAIGQVRVERASIAATLEPVLAALAAWVWLDQGLSAMQIAGGVLVIGGVASLQRKRAPPLSLCKESPKRLLSTRRTPTTLWLPASDRRAVPRRAAGADVKQHHDRDDHQGVEQAGSHEGD
jgi:drug/metabolite transporter, DME family